MTRRRWRTCCITVRPARRLRPVSAEPRVLLQHQADAGERGARASGAGAVRSASCASSARWSPCWAAWICWFTAGVVSTAPRCGRASAPRWAWLGVEPTLRPMRATRGHSAPHSRVRVGVEPTNEEWIAAQAALNCWRSDAGTALAAGRAEPARAPRARGGTGFSASCPAPPGCAPGLGLVQRPVGTLERIFGCITPGSRRATPRLGWTCTCIGRVAARRAFGGRLRGSVTLRVSTRWRAPPHQAAAASSARRNSRQNSSPPEAEGVGVQRAPGCAPPPPSTRSPASWPWVSLSCLKWSTSTMARA